MKQKPDKRKRRFQRVKYLAAATALIFVMLPGALVNSTEVTARAFITAIGTDKVPDGYEITAQFVLPKGSSGEKEELGLISSKGKTLKTALDGISSKTGKKANLAHCKLLFLGRSITEEGLISNLDFFMRSPDVDNGLMIAATSDAAKDNLKKLSEFEKNSAFSLPDFFSQNRSNGLNPVVTLNSFMEGYYEGIGDLILPVIDIIHSELSDEFKTAVIKGGRQVKTLDREGTRTLLLLDRKITRGTMLLENIGGEPRKISLDIKGKRAGIKTAFRDGKPVCCISLRFKLSLDETEGESYSSLSFGEGEKFGRLIEAAVREKIKADIQELHRQCAEEDFDVMGVTKHFYRFNNKKYKAYTAAGGNIIKDCQINVKVDADIKI